MSNKVYKYVNSFRVGCDPEFMILNSQGMYVDVSAFAREPFSSDHNGRVAEIHPEPAKSAYLVVRRIKKIFDEAPARAHAEPIWKAGGIGEFHTQTYDWDGATKSRKHVQPLGGHLHFDIPVREPEENYDIDAQELPKKNVLTLQSKIQTLDRFTDWLERLDMLPTSETHARRALGDYGRWGDFRPSNDGGHLEYRTMCSWLYDPSAAMLALTGGKICVARYEVAKDFLEANIPSRKKLKEFFTNIQEHDDDAKRLVENFAFETYQMKPDGDFRKAWEKIDL